MDYHSLKRKELQALCKKHNIPANSANSVLADKLSALLDEKPKPKARQRTCMKSLVETTDEVEPAELKRQSKKVTFSQENDLVEYELRSGEKQKETVAQTRGRRKSFAKKVDKPVDNEDTTVELNDDSAQIPVKVTRSRVQSSVKDAVIPNNEKQKGRRGAKDVEKESNVDKETEVNVGKVTRSKDKGSGVQHEVNKQSKRLVKEVKEETKTVEETVVARARVTRSKAPILIEGDTSGDASIQSKKKSGKQMKTEEQNVEPVRATRSRRQTVKVDIENTDNGTQTDKKRTRREMEATDSSNNSSHVDAVDKQEPSKRKSLRTKATDSSNNSSHVDAVDKQESFEPSKRKSSRTRVVENVNEDEGDKKEVLNKSRVTSSKAPLATVASRRDSKNKASKVEIQQPEEPLKHEGKKNINRRKSVLQPEKTEEAVNHPARKNTRRKSVVQKAAKTVESPTVGKKQSKGLSKSIEDEENITRSGKDASEIGFEEVTTETPKSRKRRGTPIIEDPVIKSSTRSGSKTEGKSVAKKQVESSSKKPVSKGNSAVRSGAIVRDSSSKKRAKLSGTKQDYEDHAVNSSKEWTPVAKLRNLKLDEEVTEPEATPATGRRLTRNIIKEQPTAEAQLFSPKVAIFRHDPAVNTAPGRITRRGSKHDGTAAGSFSEKVGKKKQTRQSAHKKPLDDAEVSSPNLAEAGPTSDVCTIAVESEIKQSLDEVQMDSLEVAEVGPTPDGGTIEVQPEIKQPSDDVQMVSPEVAEVGLASDVGNIEVQSEVKQPQSLDEVQMPSPEVAESGPIPDVDTIGDQSEIKPLFDDAQMSSPEDAEVKLNEGVDTIEVESEVEQPHDEVQMCSPEVAEVQLNSDTDTVEVGSEISKEVTGQTLGNLSASESARSQTKVVEDNIVSVEENASVEVTEDAGACNEESMTGIFFNEQQQNPLDSQSLDVGTPLEKNLSHIKMTPVPMVDVAETVSVLNQNEEVYVESGIFSEAVNLETSVLESDRPDASVKEMGSTESGSTSKGIQTDVTIEEPLDSVDQTVVGEEGVDNNCNPSIQIHEVADDGEQYDEDESVTAQKPLISLPDSEDICVADGVDVQEDPFSGNDLYDACDVQDDDINVPKELETGSELSRANKSIHVDIVRGLEDNNDVQDGESEHDELASNDNRATYNEDVGGDDSVPAQIESIPVVDEVLVKSCDQEPGQLLDVAVDDPCDRVGQSDSVASEDLLEDDTFVRVDVLVDEVLVKSCDQEPEQSLNVAVDDVPCDKVGQSDSVAREDVPEDHMVVRVDVLEESVVDIKKDVVSSILGDTCDMDAEGDGGNEQKLSEFDEGFHPNDSDMSNEQTQEEAETTREKDNTLDGEKHAAETTREKDHTLDGEKHAAKTDDDSDSDKFMEDDSHIGVKEVSESELAENIKAPEDPTKEAASPILYTKGESTVDVTDPSQHMGYIGAHESLITQESFPITYKKEESPVDETNSDLPAVKEDDENKQDENRTTGTSVDLGDYDLGMNELEKPVSINESADVEGEDKNDDQDSDLETSARTSSFIEESSGLAPGLTNSVRKLENDSRNAVDGKSNQEVDISEERANAADMTEVFNWPDSSMKSLSATPAATRISHARDNQEDAVKLTNQDADSSLKSLFTTPAATQISRVKTGQKEAANFSNQDHYSSLKSMFKTAGVTQISHVKDGEDVNTAQEDAAEFSNQDHYSSLKLSTKTPATTQISHVKGGQEDADDFANQDHYSSLKSWFTAPGTSKTIRVTESKVEAVDFTFSDSRGNEDIESSRTLPHQWDNDQLKDFDGEAQGNPETGNEDIGSSRNATHQLDNDQYFHGEAEEDNPDTGNEDIGSNRTAAHRWDNDQYFHGEAEEDNPETEMHGVESFEDLFEDKEVVCDGSDIELNQYEYSNEAAGTSHDDVSGLKDNEFEKKEDNTEMKGSKADDDLDFDTGDA